MASELKPCPFCRKPMMLREALWPSEGDTDAIIHADKTDCPMFGFGDGSADGSIVEKWNICSSDDEDDFPSDGSCIRCGSVPRNASGLCNTCLDEDAARLENTCPAPAAPVDGLERYRPEPMSLGGMVRDPDGGYVARSQAEELLAAERAEKAGWKELHDAAQVAVKERTEACNNLYKQVNDLIADNAAKDAEREAIMQAITDPENQPSKFGTVTIAFFNEKIAAKNARAKTLEQVNAKLCDDMLDYELKIAERDVSLNELKQKLADKFSFTSDDDALAVLERYGHKETGNGIIKADMRALDDMCRAAVAYLCAEWDFVFQDEVELNREALEAKLAAAEKALEPFAKIPVSTVPEGRLGHVPDKHPCMFDLDGNVLFTASDIRKARAVLGGKPS